jgi:phage baseplate assembly protein W
MEYTGLFRLYPKKSSSKDGFMSEGPDVIKNSIITLIKTRKGSRIYDPDLGTNLMRLIHELNIERIQHIAKAEITHVIEKYEPRAQILDVKVEVLGEQKQELKISLLIYMKEYNLKEVLEFKMKSDNNWINQAPDDNPLKTKGLI